MLVVVLVVTMMLSLWILPSEAQLNLAEVSALFDLCDRPGIEKLWTNCSDSANACDNSANWPGIICNGNKTAILTMYDCFASYGSEFRQSSLPVDCIRSRSDQSAVGSIPASIEKMTQLKELCGSLFVLCLDASGINDL